MDKEINTAAEWTLRDATITAVADRGKVYNERGLALRVSEGREIQLHPLGDVLRDKDIEYREVWDYQLNFYLLDGKEPDSAAQDECTVAIIGQLEDGRQCKIHGKGFVGRDNLDQIEGSFFSPPRIEIAGPEDDLTEMDRPE